MLYFKITADVLRYPEVSSDVEQDLWKITRRYESRAAELFSESILSATLQAWETGDVRMFVAKLCKEQVHMGAASPRKIAADDVRKFLSTAGIDTGHIEIEDATFSAVAALASQAYRQDFIDDDDHIIEWCGISTNRFARDAVTETLAQRPGTRDMLMQTASDLLSESLSEEISRIFAHGNVNHVSGHPVHYIIASDAEDFQREAVELLVSALAQMGRLPTGRVVSFPVADVNQHRSSSDLGLLYSIAQNAAAVLSFQEETDSPSMFGTQQEDKIVEAAQTMRRHSDDTLTIFIVPRHNRTYRTLIESEAGNVCLVHIQEDNAEAAAARRYLTNRAKCAGIPANDDLLAKIEDGKLYTVSELCRTFDRWKADRLRKVVYPQYADLQSAASTSARERPHGSAYEEFQSLIGLTDAKKQISKVLDHVRAQKLFADRGLTEYRPNMHMVFSGNPGTAKTTAARLIGQIFKDNKVLTNGDFYEVGRKDLVGRYVGWTAQIVHDKFRRAAGGVLFIDEAYSLVDDKAGLYGDEAINTIVQEMENMREDIVVIFAGYTDRMEEFIARNPGMRSRIAAHILFPDYTPNELVQITHLEAERLGLRVASSADDTLGQIYERICHIPDFGNGRYARNIVEQAHMRQSSRLLQMNLDDITDIMAITLEEHDFQEIPVRAVGNERKIGFIA